MLAIVNESIDEYNRKRKKKAAVIILYRVVCCNQINKKSLKIGATVLRPRKLTPTWAPLQQDLRVHVCALHSSAQLVDYCAANEWAFIGSQLPPQHQHVVAIIIFYAAIHRHLQWPHKKGCQQKWEMVYSEHRPAETTRMKRPGFVRAYTPRLAQKKRTTQWCEKWRGNRIKEKRKYRDTDAEAVCFRSDTNMVPFFPPPRSCDTSQ